MSPPSVPLSSLEQRADFIRRHVGPRPGDIARMLESLGLASLDELVEKTVPAAIRSTTAPGLGESHTEQEALRRLEEFASRNRVYRSFIGMGYSDCITPPVIQRNVVENPDFYTAYTAYQAEISQGRLEALLNFQTMVADLTGMEIANASLLDEGTAAAEAMSFCHGLAKKKRNAIWVAADCHPQTIDVLRCRARPLGIELRIGNATELEPDDSLLAILLQYPATDGAVRDPAALIDRAHAAGALSIVAADLLALTMLKPPGELGADVVVGSSQRFGVPLGYGGPHAAYFATREAFKRAVPGRMVGVSVDAAGRTAYRLALQTREQHIRRERATSNICTAQVLLAVIAAMYAVYHGPEGLSTIARRIHRLTALLAAGLRRLGFPIRHEQFFDTIAVEVPSAADVAERAVARRMNLRTLSDRDIGVSLDETTTREEVEALWEVISGQAAPALSLDELDRATADAIPGELVRRSEFMTHEVFNSFHSETEMLRYLHRLQNRDVTLTRSMIPLGSCTMKLNASVEMLPISWSGFSRLHPFAPLDQAQGYLELIRELETMLVRITGFSAASLQPNAGSQGEFAGLLVIRRHHEERGEAHRDICLIPSSAHGTNPASAVMAGLKVIVVKCDGEGNIDLHDLEARATEHRERLAALMVTYPSTHGVFEEHIVRVCEIVHENGGQVYMDGANLNAQVGLCLPGRFGPDVAHLNLHKTFCIPHGGGGPGVGPIVVARHLAPFLPSHRLVPEAGPATGIPAVASAPWGSANILPISWAYIYMMGDAGLRHSSEIAILNANYIVKRLAGHYDVLYRGPAGFVAHECIIDTRPLKTTAAVEVGDIARRLMDFGFHAPTISFPVPGTLMVEPTESESRAELDRFCDALIQIRREIRDIEAGRSDRQDNVIKNAPHTAEAIADDSWSHPYRREEAAFPLPWVRQNKYWPPVGAIDNVYGDRHFICTCGPVEDGA